MTPRPDPAHHALSHDVRYSGPAADPWTLRTGPTTWPIRDLVTTTALCAAAATAAVLLSIDGFWLVALVFVAVTAVSGREVCRTATVIATLILAISMENQKHRDDAAAAAAAAAGRDRRPPERA